MKKQLAALCLLTLAYGTFQMPAQADFSLNFGRHDRNHDGRWNYREFNDANNYYYRTHPGVTVRLNTRRDFDRMDLNRDGYLNMEEVRTYRNWD